MAPPPPPPNIHRIFIPQKNIHFSENPQNYEIQDFEPPKMVQANMKISEYPPPPPPPPVQFSASGREIPCAKALINVYQCMINWIFYTYPQASEIRTCATKTSTCIAIHELNTLPTEQRLEPEQKMSGMIWNQTVWHSDGIFERIFEKKS